MELRAIRKQMQESPPPPPTGTTVREWFAGLALMNPELMHGIPHAERPQEAVRLADELVRALSFMKTPSQESMTVPSTEEGLTQSWNDMCGAVKAADTKAKQERVTKPEMKRHATQAYGTQRPTIPPPASSPPSTVRTPTIQFKQPADLQRPQTPLGAFKVPGMGSYSLFRPENNDE